MSHQSRSRLWFLLHSWIGLKLSLFMSFVLITGTLAVFGQEIDWLLNEQMRAPESVAEQEVAWGASFDSLQRVYPEATLISLDRYHNDAFALHSTLLTEWGENSYLWFAPADGEFLGARSFYGVQRFLRNVHRHLMLPIKYGVPLVTSLAIPLLISLIAGFVVYKKFWRGLFRWPRFDRKPRIWLGDLHRLAGLWVSWFVALIALTSVFYLAEELGWRGTPFPQPEQQMETRTRSLPAGFTGSELDLAIDKARETLPGLEVRRVIFPANASRPLIVQGDLTAALVRPRANAVYIDPASLDVVGSYSGEELDFYTRISEAADPLHFGYFGGFLTQLLWFLLGVIMSGLSITGVLIYAERVRLGEKTKKRLEEPGRPITVGVVQGQH